MAIKLTESALRRIVREEHRRVLREGAEEDITQAYTLIQNAINGLGLGNRQKNTELRHLENYIEKVRGLVGVTTTGGGQEMFNELLRLWDEGPKRRERLGMFARVPFAPPPVDIQDLVQNYVYTDRIGDTHIAFDHKDKKAYPLAMQFAVEDFRDPMTVRGNFRKMQQWLRSIGMKTS